MEPEEEAASTVPGENPLLVSPPRVVLTSGRGPPHHTARPRFLTSHHTAGIRHSACAGRELALLARLLSLYANAARLPSFQSPARIGACSGLGLPV